MYYIKIFLTHKLNEIFIWLKCIYNIWYFKHGNIPHCDIPLSQVWNSQVNIEYHESSDRLCIVPQNHDENSASINIENIATANNHQTDTQEQPLSVTPTRESTGTNWLFSDKPNIPQRHSDTPTSSIDINHIAISHSHNGIIQNQNQSLSVPLAQQSVNGTQQALLRSSTQQSFIEEHRSVDLNAPIGTTDDTSLTLISIPDADINDTGNNSGNIATRVRAKNEKARKNIVHETSQHFNTLNIHTLTHPSNQDTNNVDNSSETSESQSIDINSIKINTYVPNDCESLPINIDEIAIGRRESEREKMGERDGDGKQGNDKSDREKGRKADTENDKERETERDRERGTGKSGSEKRRKMEGKSENRTERKERRNSMRKSEKRNDSVPTDEEKDSIASRMKRRRNQQPNDDDDGNNSYEY